MTDKLSSHEPSIPDFLDRIRACTAARVLTGRVGGGYQTNTQLELRQAHAAARDAVRAELELGRDFDAEFVAFWKLFEISTEAKSKDEYLLRPDLGRRLNQDSVRTLQARCLPGADLQIVIGDGLSVTAVAAQVPGLLPLIAQQAKARSWELGQPFVIRHCRVGVMNHIGELLSPHVVVLLIGERPGLATAESLSAYMAFRPNAGHTDAQRNLISNIHAQGVSMQDAAKRIIALAARMMLQKHSGVNLKEEIPGLPASGSSASGDLPR
jgi:ethanolamine ammonia-lyase small subunit